MKGSQQREDPRSGAFVGNGVAEIAFVLLFGAILVSVLGVGILGVPEHFGVSLSLYGLGSLAWAGAWWSSYRVTPSAVLRWVVIAGAVLLRLVAFGPDPGLSDDVNRYVWEGGLVLEGESPYAHAPSSAERSDQRERWALLFDGVNHPDVSAAYPPGAQAANAFVVWLAGGVQDGRRPTRFLRVFYALCDLGVLVLLLRLLRRERVPFAAVVAWGWCPLVVLEFAGSAHLDSLAILCTVAGLSVIGSRSERGKSELAAALALGCGVLVKLLPMALLPFALRRARRPWIGSLGLLLLGTTAFLAVGVLDGGLSGLGTGLGEYTLRWESTNLVHRWVEALLGGVFERDGSWQDPRRLARGLSLFAWLAVAADQWRRRTSIVVTASVLFGAFLVLTPTLHPWYVTWIVPFLALRPSLGFGFLVAAAPLLYWPLRDWHARGVWHEPVWLWPALALPFFLLLAFDLRRGWAGGKA